jgi:signal transduction histidine kinase
MLASDQSADGKKSLRFLSSVFFLFTIRVALCQGPQDSVSLLAEIREDLQQVQEAGKSRDRTRLAWLYLSLGNKYLSLKKQDSAQSYLNRALYEAEVNARPEVLIKVIPLLVNIYQEKSDDPLTGSKTYLKKSLALQNKLLEALRKNPATNLQHVWYKFGELYEWSEEYPIALEHFRKAFELTNGDSDSCYFKMGSVYEKMHLTDSAMRCYQHALRFSLAKKNTPLTVRSIMAMGDLNRQSRMWEPARTFYHNGIDLALEKKDSSQLAIFEARIGRAWHEQEFFDEAGIWLRKAIPVCIAHGLREEAAGCYQLLAEESWRSGAKPKAMELLKKAEQLILRSPAIPLRQAIFNLAIQWYEEEGNYRDAHFYQKRLSQFMDSLEQVRFRQVSNELKNDKKDKELQRLRTQNMVLQSEANEKRLIEWGLIGLAGAVIIALMVIYRSWRSRQRLHQQLQNQNVLIHEQKVEMQSALDALSQTRTKMVEGEKMSSLGQAAAGIIQELGEPLSRIATHMPTIEATLSSLVRMAEECDSINQELVKEYKVDIELMNNSIRNGISRSSRILDGLHTFSTLGFDETRVELVEKSIELVLGLQEKKLSKNKVTAHLQRSAHPLPIKANTSQLTQVWINLIDNAIYALEKRAEDRRIDIAVTYTDTHALVTIRDNGEGIPEEVQPRILEPFFTTKPVGIGTGLGLSITFGIIQKHGGHLSFTSKQGEGTCFQIELPLHVDTGLR